jgi:hypothetical protein
MSTMPDVAVGWLRSLWGTLGGILGQENSYLGRAGFITSIWDVLVLQGEQKQALLGSLGSIFHDKITYMSS